MSQKLFVHHIIYKICTTKYYLIIKLSGGFSGIKRQVPDMSKQDLTFTSWTYPYQMIKLSSRGCVRISMNFTIKFRYCNKYKSNLLIFSNKKKENREKNPNLNPLKFRDFRIFWFSNHNPIKETCQTGYWKNSEISEIRKISESWKNPEITSWATVLGIWRYLEKINPDPSDFRDLEIF